MVLRDISRRLEKVITIQQMFSNMRFELEKLIEHNKKVSELFSLGFYKYLRENKSIGITIGGTKNPGLEKHFPSEDSTRSFILTLRLLTRDGKERISFGCLRQYYEDLPIPESIKKTYYLLHDSLNTYLDSSTGTTFSKIPGLTNRRLLNVFLYGSYAHYDDKKKRILEYWNTLVAYPSLDYEFLLVLWELMEYMEKIKQVNEKTIEYLRS